MGVAVFKTGAVKDPSFFGLYEALSNSDTLSNGILITVAKSGLLSTLFAVALLASGQNSTITGTLTGQVIYGGIHSYENANLAKTLNYAFDFSYPSVNLCNYYKQARNDSGAHSVKYTNE